MQAAARDSQTGPALAPHPVLDRFYERPEERPVVLKGLFDDTARYYDRMNTLISAGTGARYRREVLERIGVGPGHRVLDVACGTGQVSEAAARLVGPSGLVLGVDPSDGMRHIAESRRGIRTVAGTAENLPVGDGTFDFVVMGYALRHASDLVAAFREARRVLRPGGTVAILEITPPEGRLARSALKFHFKWVIPGATLLVTGSRRAVQLMHYYWDSIEQCVSPASILEAMARAGLENPTRQRTLQIFNEYVARAPAGA